MNGMLLIKIKIWKIYISNWFLTVSENWNPKDDGAVKYTIENHIPKDSQTELSSFIAVSVLGRSYNLKSANVTSFVVKGYKAL